jgi:uncharacterized tellurite resistance protein B-like protein
MSLLDWLGIGDTEELDRGPGGETETVRRIVNALDELPPHQARYVASFAYILGRVAHADLDISDDETRVMEKILVERGGLPQEQAIIAVQIAKTQNLLFGGTEDFLVTREFDRIAGHEEKIALLDCLFAVSSSDASISSAEDSEIRKIASELHLDHGEFIDARARYVEYLEVLRHDDGAVDAHGAGPGPDGSGDDEAS